MKIFYYPILLIFFVSATASALVKFECATYKLPAQFIALKNTSGKGELVVFPGSFSETHIPIEYKDKDLSKIRKNKKDNRILGEFTIDILDGGTAPKNVKLVEASALPKLENFSDVRSIKLVKKCGHAPIAAKQSATEDPAPEVLNLPK